MLYLGGPHAAGGRRDPRARRTAAMRRWCRSTARVPRKPRRRRPKRLPERSRLRRLRLRPRRQRPSRLRRRAKPAEAKKEAQEVTGLRDWSAGRPSGRPASFPGYHHGWHTARRSSSASATRARSTGSRATTRASGSWTSWRGATARSSARTRATTARSAACRSTAARWLLKPQTYMNRSGLSIRALLDYVKAPAGEMLVVHDELDLPPGTARFKLGGGHGGHNGLRDTITHCGAGLLAAAPRHRPPGRQSQVIDYVLQRAAPADEEAIMRRSTRRCRRCRVRPRRRREGDEAAAFRRSKRLQ